MHEPLIPDTHTYDLGVPSTVLFHNFLLHINARVMTVSLGELL